MILHYEATEKEVKQFLKRGFKEHRSSRSFYYNLTNEPFVGNEAAPVDAVLKIDLTLPDDVLTPFETTPQGAGFRTFRLPAVWINRYSKVCELKELETA